MLAQNLKQLPVLQYCGQNYPNSGKQQSAAAIFPLLFGIFYSTVVGQS